MIRVGLIIALLWMSGPATAADGEEREVQQWLDRMALAVDGLTYQGTLVFIRGSQIDALRIFHSVTPEGVRERLVSLTGAPREVLRDNDTVRCILPDRQSVLIDTRIAERLFPSIPPDQVVQDGGRYRFSFGGRERVAQLESRIIDIEPLDGLRYGYRLWLESNTGMLLKSSLLDTDGQPLEQVMFTDIAIGGHIAETDLMPDIGHANFVQVDIPRTVADHSVEDDGHWHVADLPEGFILAGRRHGDEGRGEMEHLIFTDGLASVSVYVEAYSGGEGPPAGATRLGAVGIYGLRLEGYTVTAVGEVPAETLEQMAASIQPANMAAR